VAEERTYFIKKVILIAVPENNNQEGTLL